MSSSASAPQTSPGAPPWTVRGLIASHKAASLGLALAGLVTVTIFVVTALGAKAGAITDRSTCAQWGSANVSRQSAYASLYVREHGPVDPRWGSGPVGVINAINAGCYQAFGEDVSDTATVVQAISRKF